MLRHAMFPLILHLFTLTLYGLIFDVDANCQKGQKVVVSGNTKKCGECKSGHFQDKEDYSLHCQTCRNCDTESGSVIDKPCTKTSNTICKCAKGFVARDKDYSTCQCNAGFGKVGKECTECEDESFSTSIDSPCKKWQKCKFGEKVRGTRTSDVICNDVSQNDTSKEASPTLGKAVTSDRADQGGEHTLLTTIVTTTIMSPTRQITHPNTKVQPSTPPITAESFGFLITFVTVGLLVLAVMIIKLYFAFYKEKHESLQKEESLYGRPVEEIGLGSQVSLKMDPEEN